MAGFRKHGYNRRSTTDRFDRRKREAREASDILITSRGLDYAQFVQHKLKFCNDGWQAYHQPYVRELKFDVHQKKLAAMYAVAKKIIGRSANRWNEALIFFGHWTWKANSPIRRVRTPPKLLRFCFQQLGSSVIVINECRASKLRNFCTQTMVNDDYRDSFCVYYQPIERTLAPAPVWRIEAHENYLKRNPDACKIRTFTRDLNEPFRQKNQNHSPMSSMESRLQWIASNTGNRIEFSCWAFIAMELFANNTKSGTTTTIPSITPIDF